MTMKQKAATVGLVIVALIGFTALLAGVKASALFGSLFVIAIVLINLIQGHRGQVASSGMMEANEKALTIVALCESQRTGEPIKFLAPPRF